MFKWFIYPMHTITHFLRHFIRYSLLANISIAIVFINTANAQQNVDPQIDRPKIALVLSGGGARGAAHLGVLKVLEDLRVPIDLIIGTSMGAVVGGTYASGMDINQMETRIKLINSDSILRDEAPRQKQTERRRQDDKLNFIGPEFGFHSGTLHLPKGAVSGIRLEALLRSLATQGDDSSFDALPIPFRAVTTDIENGQMHLLSSGSLVAAMRASMSIPGLFTPMELDGLLLIDGGLSRNLPIEVARDMGVDIIIAVDVSTQLMSRDQVTSLFGVSAQVINILGEGNKQESLSTLTTNDILITPELGNFDASDFDRMSGIVQLGEIAAKQQSTQLQKLSMSRLDYAKHRASQRLIIKPHSKPIDEIRFVGLDRVNPEVLHSLLKTKTGLPLNTTVIDNDLERIYGRGDFVQVRYRMLNENSRLILEIDAQEKTTGPNFLRFGLGLSNDFSGNAHFQALISHRQTWINSLGAEWRNDLKIGRINQISSEFYQPISQSQTFFFAPYIDLEQKPSDIYSGPKRIARFTRQSANIGLDVGAEISTIGEIRLGIFQGNISFDLDTGPVELQKSDASVNTAGIRLRLDIDQLDSRKLPRSGYAFSVNILKSNPQLGALDSYTRWDTSFISVFTLGTHTLQVALRAGDHSGGDTLPEYDLFQLGGFLKLSGLQDGQLLGQSYKFGRLVYGHQITKLPLLQGFFGGFSLETGQVDNPLIANNSSESINAASIFLATDTPIGPAYLGLGHAEGGNTALYLFLGIPLSDN